MAQERPVWLVTGCSTGLGRNIAGHLLNLGYRVVVTARRTDRIDDLKGRGEALVLPLDVTDRAQAETAVKTAEEASGGIDVLGNNAGIGYFAAVEESDGDQVRRLFDVNFFGVANMIHAVLPGMRRRRQGMIVNLTLIGGLRGFLAVGYYCATKFAIEELPETLRAGICQLPGTNHNEL